jgi:hypothetical protein
MQCLSGVTYLVPQRLGYVSSLRLDHIVQALINLKVRIIDAKFLFWAPSSQEGEWPGLGEGPISLCNRPDHVILDVWLLRSAKAQCGASITRWSSCSPGQEWQDISLVGLKEID